MSVLMIHDEQEMGGKVVSVASNAPGIWYQGVVISEDTSTLVSCGEHVRLLLTTGPPLLAKHTVGLTRGSPE